MPNASKALTPFWGCALIAAAIVYHAQSGRFHFQSEASPVLAYYKFDTRSGDVYFCGTELDQCTDVSDKAAFLKSYNANQI